MDLFGTRFLYHGGSFCFDRFSTSGALGLTLLALRISTRFQYLSYEIIQLFSRTFDARLERLC